LPIAGSDRFEGVDVSPGVDPLIFGISEQFVKNFF